MVGITNGENRNQDSKRGEGGKSILNEFKIANFTLTLDHIPKGILLHWGSNESYCKQDAAGGMVKYLSHFTKMS